jgi:IS6 family transposase
VDKSAAHSPAFKGLIQKSKLSKPPKLPAVKYLNNIIEQDHRQIKKKTNAALGYKTFHTAWFTITGIETMLMLKKGRIDANLNKNHQLLRQFIHRLFDIPGPIFPEFSNR